ncbi:MAG TPA: transglycosylase SLT domain-containing protein, partial [Kofleriaceae bacterium]|nr:transglycosylase SLT domain-containing protein [Kofleriaceae bacterium]
GARFALEDWAGARELYAKARDGAKDDLTRARATLMIGLCDARLAAWDKAADEIAEAGTKLPELADFLRYQEARARYFAHQIDRVYALASQVDPTAIQRADAELLIGDVLRAGNDPKATAAWYADYLKRRPNGPRVSEARFRMAEALGDTDEARAIYRQIDIEDPTSSWAEKARPKAEGGPKLTATEHVTRGKALFEAMRNPEGQAEFEAALADPKITIAEKCVAAYHRAQSMFKARNRKDAAPAFDAAVAACKKAKNLDLTVRSAYQAGRSYAYLRDHKKAAARYAEAEKLGPQHSLADDARLRQAEEWTSLNDDKKIVATLSSLPDKYPKGDMRAEAMWRLGWHAWKAGKADDAIAWWKKQIAVMPIDDNYYAEGQAQYWIGRALASKNDSDGAIASYEDAIHTYPMSYYALLALNRIRELDAKKYDETIADIQKDPPGWDASQPSFTFAPRPEWQSEGFTRAMEFLRLGLGGETEGELRALKLTPPEDKNRVDDPDEREKLWAIAFLYDRAGRYATSHWPTRWHILDYKRQWPVGANLARWRIAFPRAYWDLLESNAKKNGVSPYMQIAIVREESAFDPLMESYANAIGLTQMIPTTGKRFAQGTGYTADRESLRDPEKNVTIGSRFLGFLWARWNGYLTLVPPSYNAGETGVDRMLKMRGTWPADEFVEGIVDDQARNYTKRVLTSFFDYSYLYGSGSERVPVMDNQIPAEFVTRAQANPYAKDAKDPVDEEKQDKPKRKAK